MNIALTVGLLAVLFNVAATVAVIRSELYQRRQIALQLFVIWLIPALGAALCWYMLHQDQRPQKEIERSGNEYAESMYNAVNNEHTNHHGGTDGSH